MATETYKYGGSSEPGRGSGPLILEGSIVNPKESVQIGETVDLDEEKVKEYRARGLKLTKSSDGDDEPKNATAGESGEAETQQQQQRAQRPDQPTTANAPGAGSQGKSK